MFKSRILLGAAIAALALASAAFATPPPTAQSSPGVNRTELSKASEAVKSELSAPAIAVADSGTGAASAYKAWEKKRLSAAPAVRKISAADLGLELRVAASEPRTLHEFARMHPGLKPEDVMSPVQRAQLLRLVQTRFGEPCSAPRPFT